MKNLIFLLAGLAGAALIQGDIGGNLGFGIGLSLISLFVFLSEILKELKEIGE